MQGHQADRARTDEERVITGRKRARKQPGPESEAAFDVSAAAAQPELSRNGRGSSGKGDAKWENKGRHLKGRPTRGRAQGTGGGAVHNLRRRSQPPRLRLPPPSLTE